LIDELENAVKTYTLKGRDITPTWHVLDAEGRPLGRLAVDVARLLRGKHRPTFTPHLDNGDFVVVVNASKVKLTGSKIDQKVYYRHTGYMGGLKETPMAVMLEKHPERVLRRAVRGMMPQNRLSRALLRHLKIYAGPEHPHQAQVKDGAPAPQPEPVAAAAVNGEES
jgi:large subunit ribosomal protein L13